MKAYPTRGAKLALAVFAASTWICAAQEQGTQNPPENPPAEQDKPQQVKPEQAKPQAAEPVKILPVSVDPKTFNLGPEDVILVRVWREPDLSGTFVVRPDGIITMPLIREVKAAGLTPEQLGAQISDRLSKYVNNPQVVVLVEAVRSKRYYISGEVNRPGAYPLAVATTVFQALSMSGGFRDFANKKKITIVRGTKRLKFNYNDVVKGKNLSQNVLLENGDQIIVP